MRRMILALFIACPFAGPGIAQTPGFITTPGFNFPAPALTPSQITANQNNYFPGGLSGAASLRLNTDASRNITGLANGVDGRILVIHNVGANPIVFTDEDAASTAANRFAFNANLTINSEGSVILRYDGTSSRWRAAATGLLDTITAANINSVRYANQFAGSDACVKITAALADLPTAGGIVDAVGLEGAQTCAATLTLNKPVSLLLGAATYTLASGVQFSVTSAGVAIVGIGREDTTINSPTAGIAIPSAVALDRVRLENFSLVKTGTVRETGSIGIKQIAGQHWSYRNLWVKNFEIGIQLDDNAGANAPVDTHMELVRASSNLIGLDMNSTTAQITTLYAYGLTIVGPGVGTVGGIGMRQDNNSGRGGYILGASIEGYETCMVIGSFGWRYDVRLEDCTTGITYAGTAADSNTINVLPSSGVTTLFTDVSGANNTVCSEFSCSYGTVDSLLSTVQMDVLNDQNQTGVRLFHTNQSVTADEIYGELQFWNNDSTAGTENKSAALKTINVDTTNGRFARLGIFTASGVSTDAERISVLRSGAVGIGDTTPTEGLLTVATDINAALYETRTNCADSAGDAACTAAPAGSVVVDATDTTTVVSTTAVTANSQIFIQIDASLGTLLSVTCNTQDGGTFDPRITARTAGTSFTITLDAGPTTNPLCLSYFIVN